MQDVNNSDLKDTDLASLRFKRREKSDLSI